MNRTLTTIEPAAVAWAWLFRWRVVNGTIGPVLVRVFGKPFFVPNLRETVNPAADFGKLGCTKLMLSKQTKRLEEEPKIHHATILTESCATVTVSAPSSLSTIALISEFSQPTIMASLPACWPHSSLTRSCA